MTPLEHHLFAYYATHTANELSITGRWYPHGELVMIIADKIQVEARQFGRQAAGQAKGAAAAFVDHMIAKGAWATQQNKFGGSMHQFQGDAYKAALRELQASDPIIQQAAAAGEGFWAEAFASLTAQ